MTTLAVLGFVLAGSSFVLYQRAPTQSDVATARAAGYTEGSEVGASQAEESLAVSRAMELNEAREQGYDEGLSVGQEMGHDTGYADGEATGYSAGYSQGVTDGYAAGHADGYVAASADDEPIYGDDPEGYYANILMCMINPEQYGCDCDN